MAAGRFGVPIDDEGRSTTKIAGPTAPTAFDDRQAEPLAAPGRSTVVAAAAGPVVDRPFGVPRGRLPLAPPVVGRGVFWGVLI